MKEKENEDKNGNEKENESNESGYLNLMNILRGFWFLLRLTRTDLYTNGNLILRVVKINVVKIKMNVW